MNTGTGSFIVAKTNCVIALLCLFGAVGGHAQTCEPHPEKRIYWGDLHVHTSFSMDAYVWNNQVTPELAYAFAKGATQRTPSGSIVKLHRPLDFAAVTDHAEYFAVIKQCLVDAGSTAYCKDLRAASTEESRRGFYELFLPALLRGDRLCQTDAGQCALAEQALWQRTAQAAHAANEPCRFTAFVANEWTASPDNLHWHRNLIYANGQVPQRAINAFDEPAQEDLWAALDERCGKIAGCDVLAIPHNGNIGMGGAFSIDEQDIANLKLRAQFEKLVEIHQHKGSSECYSGSNFTDEACDFEYMMPIPLTRALQQEPRDLTSAEHRAIASGYVRDTLARGLRVKADTGVNPFVYGFIGSTDTHAGRPGDVAESNWHGAIGSYDENVERRQSYRSYNPGGLVAVWAQANTRSHVFAALKRREVYATSGPRIGLRFSVTAASEPDICVDSAAARTSLRPMGSTYDGVAAPTFVVEAAQDEVPLAQIEIVRLSFRDGQLKQNIHKWSAPQQGRSDWCESWTDTSYVQGIPTAWYARVLQKPTLRWDGQSQIQERAWSSPIWTETAVNE